MTAAREGFDWFVRKLRDQAPDLEEGASALPTTIAETVRALDPRAFQTIAHSTLATAPFLLALEESQIPGTSLRYVLVHDEIGPAGFLLLTTVPLDITGLMRDAATSEADSRNAIEGGSFHPGRRRKDGPTMAKILIGGHPLFRGNHFFDFRDPQPTPSLLATMARAAYRIRCQEDVGVSLLVDLADEDIPRLSPLEGYGYSRFESPPSMVLRIDPRWKTFNVYAASLPGPARKLIRDRRKVFEEKGLVLERARPTPIAAELAELHAHYSHRTGGRMAILTPSFFRAVEDHLRDAFRLWVARKDGRIIAFVCAIHDRIPSKGRNRLLGLSLGLNVRLNDEFRLGPNLQYRLIEEAIAEGFDSLDFGRASPQLKADLGASSARLHCYVRLRSPTKNPLLRVLFEQIIQPSRTGRHGSR